MSDYIGAEENNYNEMFNKNYENFEEFLDNLPRVTSSQFFLKDKYHPEGLFSEQIFGPVKDYRCQCGKLEGIVNDGKRCMECGVECTSSFVRYSRFAVIELPFKIPLPQIIINNQTTVKRLNKIYDNIDIDPTRYVLSKHLKKDYSEITESEYEKLTTRFVVVIPPETRPHLVEGGKDIFDQINNDYKHIISKVNSYHRRSISIVQHQIKIHVIQSELFLTIKKKLAGGKKSIIRKNLLGKRIPAGRTVITPNPYLPGDKIMIPLKVAAKIFAPLIIKHLQHEFSSYDIFEAIDKIYHDIDTPLKKRIIEVLNQISVDNLVLINRQPTLHVSNIQAYRWKLSDTDTMQLPNVILAPFNADFDGDSILGKVKLYDKTGRIIFDGEIEDLIDFCD